MAIQPSDLIQPAGELPADLFAPTEEERVAGKSARNVLLERIGREDPPAGWLGSAAAVTDVEAARKLYAYHLAYQARYLEGLNAPSTVQQDGEGSTQYLISQIDKWRVLSEQRYAQFLAATAPAVATSAQPVGTTSVSATSSWG